MTKTVIYEQKGGVALLTLNRPKKLNALNYQTIDRLMLLLNQIEDDANIRAVILTGNGRAFSAGGDIPEFAQSIEQGVDVALKQFCRRGQNLTKYLENFPKPIIAAVNGLAFGGGCEITEAVHLAIATEQAIFAKPEINIGIPPTFGGTQRLPRLVGRKRALELLLTGDYFSARRTYEMGLINKIVSQQELLPAAFEMAARILRHSSLTSARIIAAVTRGINTTIDEGLQIEAEQFARMAATDEVNHRLSAWLDGAAPESQLII
ncbi:MAG: enoyl-CoA hydratase [Hyphomicrobiales bacterium]|nr:MAG: enoyl-CoA hydratase [Hyphomicrobiales bacterium]